MLNAYNSTVLFVHKNSGKERSFRPYSSTWPAYVMRPISAWHGESFFDNFHFREKKFLYLSNLLL